MKLIAKWGSHNKRAAQIIIALSHLLIAILACYVGIGLQSKNISLPVEVFWTTTTAAIFLFFIFRNATYRRLPFSRRKMADLLLGLCSFIMIASSANQPTTSHFVIYTSLHGALPEKVEPVKKASIKELKKQWKEIKTMVKREGASGTRIALAVLAGLLLLYVVAALACSASCNGQDALAVIVLIGGIAGIFFVVRAILRGGRRSQKKQSVQPSSQ